MSRLNWACTRRNVFNATFDSNAASLSVLWGQIAILFIICLTIACCLIFWFQPAATALHMLRMFFSGIWSIANCHLVAFALLRVFVCVISEDVFWTHRPHNIQARYAFIFLCIQGMSISTIVAPRSRHTILRPQHGRCVADVDGTVTFDSAQVPPELREVVAMGGTSESRDRIKVSVLKPLKNFCA